MKVSPSHPPSDGIQTKIIDNKTMKKSLLTMCAVYGTMIGTSSAVILASDDFTYADGPLAGNNGGTGWASAWEVRPLALVDTIVGGQAVVGGDNSLVFDQQATSYRNLATPVAAVGEVWMSVDLGFTSGGSDPNAFIGITFRSGDPADFGDPTDRGWRVGDDWDGVADGFTVEGGADGVATQSGFPSSVVSKVVVLIDYNLGSTSMWIDPANGPLGVPDAVDAGDAGTFDTFMIRTSGDGATYREATFDNFVLATTQAEVHNVVPEPSSSALLGLAGLVLILRRRK